MKYAANSFKLSAITTALLLSTQQIYAADTSLISYVSGKSIIGSSSQPSISYDASKVVFTSTAGTLVGDSTTLQHIYLKNLSDGSINRISVHSNGNKANSISFNPKISGDGQYIAYYSLANNLVDADNNGFTDVFVYDITNKTTRIASTNKSGLQANAESTEAAISRDGRYVAFSSLANNLVSTDTKGKRNVYVKDMQTGELEIISVNNSGIAGDSDSFLPAISGNGRYVVYSSIANNLDQYPANNQYDIFLFDRETRTTERLTLNASGTLSNGHSGQVSISDDGEIISYISVANNLVSNDKNGFIDVFFYEKSTKTTKRITLGNTEADGPGFYPQISGNGRFIAFYSGASNLVSGDSKIPDDLLVYDRVLGSISKASLSSSGTQADSNIDSVFSINYDGSYAAFSTASSLDSNDTNKQMDVYLRHMDPPPNLNPVAKAKPIASQACTNGGASIILDASDSYDLDGQDLSYSWSGSFGTITGKIAEIILGPGVQTITLTVTDTAGGNQSTSFTVNITDTTPPVVKSDADITLEATSTQGANHTVNYQASDNCQLSNILISPSLNYYPLGTTVVTVTASDTLGNKAASSTNINVQDTTAPALKIPVNISKEADAVRTKVNIGNATATDIFSVTVENDAPADFPLGNSKINWKATDSNGNTASAIQTVVIKDTTAPVLNIPADKTVEASNNLMNIDIGQATASDIFLTAITHNAPALFPLGITNVLWTASDSSGNLSSATQIISVLDRIAPELLVDNAVILEATSKSGAPYEIKYQTSDSCINCGNINVNFDPILHTYPLGNTVVNVTARDASNNATNKQVSITVQDTTPPVLTIPQNIKQEATEVLSTVTLGQATATDIFYVSISNNAPTKFSLGSTNITWTATDSNGNTTTGTQQIEVSDTTAPVLTLPADIQIEASDINSIVEIGKAKATDIFNVTINSDAPLSYPLGTTNVTWTATDDNGNQTKAIQKITVSDSTPPVITLPANVKMEATGRTTAVNIGQANASDIFKYTLTSDAPLSYSLGDTIVTWTAVDINGNKTSAQQTISVVDTTPPVVIAGKDVTLEATSTLGAEYKLNYSATDICDCGELKFDIMPILTNYPLGETSVTVTATDISGNSSSDTMIVKVVDSTKPDLTIPGNIVTEATGILTPVILGNTKATDIFNVSVENNAPELFPLGNTVVTWKARDINGNETIAQQSVTVIDSTAPGFDLNMFKNELWPANHKMIHVGNVQTVSDIVDVKPVVNIEITTTDDHQRKRHEPDWKIIETGNEWQIWLRAEKAHHEDRIYTINVTVSDFTGNQNQSSAEVIVPHHRKHDEDPNDQKNHHTKDKLKQSKKDKERD